ncbi:hypothetical protein pEaSNUABM37_00140 [Erwinia phage pEa_SNUABM_37]|nr:hypothetical protein pEaSNUABM37_00140 [Erwinia phage pEa_SNUABM_37]QXO10610.1 hypothetical protein pEaSNUABM48_00140 [Erwinia phage pEa_SNUABM_48]
MEATINIDVFEKIGKIFEVIDRVCKPKKVYEYPKKYHLIRQVEVDGETCNLIFDFDRHLEYVVHPKPKH